MAWVGASKVTGGRHGTPWGKSVKTAVGLLRYLPAVILEETLISPRSEMDSAKKQAQDLIENLPDDVTWDELAYKIYVRRSIEQGIQAADEGRLRTEEDIRRRLGLDE